MGAESIKLIANNKKHIMIILSKTRMRQGFLFTEQRLNPCEWEKCSVKESFVRIENGEVFIYGMHISPYEKGNIF